MEVNKENFEETLVNIKSLLPSADFVSFDTELTGLGRSAGNKYSDLDTVEERYGKARKAVVEHGIIQFGMSIFRFCLKQKKYFTSTYCFYLAGKKDGCYKYDVSAMNFLAQNGFNFNKLFLEGLHFMSITEEHNIRLKKEKRLAEEQVTQSPVKLKDPEAKKFVKESLEKVAKSKKEEKPAMFSGISLSGFQRKLLYNNVAPAHPNSLFRSVPGAQRNIEVLHFESSEEKSTFINEEWEANLLAQLGFARVIQLLLECGKPLVTHNGMLDILHFVDKFIAPLPESLADFRLLCVANLPKIYDTKLLAKDPPFSGQIMNTGLQLLYEELSSHYSPPDVKKEDKLDSSYELSGDSGPGSGRAHDAGYDAFMTGVCFLIMIKALEGPRWGSSPPMQIKRLKTFCNRLNFMHSLDVPFFDLHNEQATSSRDHILTIDCPPTFSMMESRECLRKLGTYKVSWVNDAKFHVIIQDNLVKKNMSTLLREVSSCCPPNVHVSQYKIPPKTSRSANGANKTSKVNPPKLKRRSDDQEMEETSENPSEAADSSVRNLKRLKSVGYDLILTFLGILILILCLLLSNFSYY